MRHIGIAIVLLLISVAVADSYSATVRRGEYIVFSDYALKLEDVFTYNGTKFAYFTMKRSCSDYWSGTVAENTSRSVNSDISLYVGQVLLADVGAAVVTVTTTFSTSFGLTSTNPCETTTTTTQESSSSETEQVSYALYIGGVAVTSGVYECEQAELVVNVSTYKVEIEPQECALVLGSTIEGSKLDIVLSPKCMLNISVEPVYITLPVAKWTLKPPHSVSQSYDENITRLQNQVRDLNSKIENLTTMLDRLSGQISELNKKVTEVQKTSTGKNVSEEEEKQEEHVISYSVACANKTGNVWNYDLSSCGSSMAVTIFDNNQPA
ncbi:MAG: hypothetical protein DRO14_00430, partial [Thermoprotei archaeon]